MGLQIIDMAIMYRHHWMEQFGKNIWYLWSTLKTHTPYQYSNCCFPLELKHLISPIAEDRGLPPCLNPWLPQISECVCVCVRSCWQIWDCYYCLWCPRQWYFPHRVCWRAANIIVCVWASVCMCYNALGVSRSHMAVQVFPERGFYRTSWPV